MPEPEDSIDGQVSGEATEPPGSNVPAPKLSPQSSGSRRTSSGLKIPGYHIDSIIGRGSTGTVYRARQENVDREVALKVLHKELTGRPRMVRRLQREARTTARLAHPHIVSAIDMGRTGERWWFAMELVDGPSLALKLRQEGRLSEREALRLFIPLCEALVHIWENGVVHRDIKPANILIDRVSGACLADLGLAFADNDPHLTGSEGTLGTPHYISPEQARDPSSVDIRTDIWSFGATLFHATCGEPPLRGANVAEVLSGVLYGRVPDPVDLEPDLSRGFSLVLRKCLSRDFERRYQTPRDLLRDLERVRERRRPKVRAASLDRTSGAGSQGPQLLFAAGMFGLLLLGAFLLWRRPWETAIGHVVYAPLAALQDKLENGGVPPGPLLRELEAMGGELPAGDLSDWRELLSLVRTLRDGILGEIENETVARFEKDLAKGDFGRAADAVGVDLESVLVQKAGLSLNMVPTDFRLRIVSLEQRLARSLDTATARMRAAVLESLADPYLAEVEDLVKHGRWKSASERLGIVAEDLPGELGIDIGSLPLNRQSSLVDLVSSRLVNARVDLGRGWRLFDEELVRWIDLAARDLSDEVSSDLEPVNAGARLRDAFEQELARRGTTRAEFLVAPAGLARVKLSEVVADLEEYERRVSRGRDFGDRDALDSLMSWLEESAVGAAWKKRRYEEVRSYWEGRQRWLAMNAAVSALWRGKLEDRVEGRLAEVDLLLNLRDRATEALAEYDGKVLELHMSAEVVSPGSLAVLASGPEGGMSFFVGKQRGYELFVAEPRGGLPMGGRLIDAADIESFGIARIPEEQAGLARALFRFREGQVDSAYELLLENRLGPPWEGLVEELVRNTERTRSVRAKALSLREGQARILLATLYVDEPDNRDRLQRDPERAVMAIERLLSEFGDLELVSLVAGNLKALMEELRGPGSSVDLEDFEAAFGKGVVRFQGSRKVALEYDFAYSQVYGFSPGAWRPDGVGWLSPGDIASDEDLLRRASPRLVLRSPLGIDMGLIICEFTFVEPLNTGDERLVLATAAGFDFAVRTSSGDVSSIVIAGSHGSTRLLNDLRSGAGDRVPRALLSPGKTHTLRLELDKRRGRILALLDGVEVLQKELSSPLGKPGSYGLSLRSREQVRLLSARVIAPL